MTNFEKIYPKDKFKNNKSFPYNIQAYNIVNKLAELLESPNRVVQLETALAIDYGDMADDNNRLTDGTLLAAVSRIIEELEND